MAVPAEYLCEESITGISAIEEKEILGSRGLQVFGGQRAFTLVLGRHDGVYREVIEDVIEDGNPSQRTGFLSFGGMPNAEKNSSTGDGGR